MNSRMGFRSHRRLPRKGIAPRAGGSNLPLFLLLGVERKYRQVINTIRREREMMIMDIASFNRSSKTFF